MNPINPTGGEGRDPYLPASQGVDITEFRRRSARAEVQSANLLKAIMVMADRDAVPDLRIAPRQCRNYRAEIARLDALSRTRALTEAESILLERMLWRVERKGTRRADYGTNKALARVGVERRAA
jgi:hypothetical protein